MNEAHQFRRERDGLVRVVRNAQPDEQVGETHNAQTDLAIAHRRGLDGFQRVAVHIDHVIEKADAPLDAVPQLVPVHGRPADRGAGPFVLRHLVQVDRGQDAALVGQQRHLAAGIGRLDPADPRRRIAPVDVIEEDQARVSRSPGGIDDQVEERASAKLPDALTCMGIHQIERPVIRDGPQKSVRDAHGQIEVSKGVRTHLRFDEIDDIRMIAAQDAHVRAPASAALDDHLRRLVVRCS